MTEADWCCGSAGSQLITHYETSKKVMARKVGNIKSTGADYVSSGCPGCQMQIITGVKDKKLNVKVVHPIELLDRAYGDQKE
jgi:glycolate oxidase iron-sulfur subunit